MIQPRRLPSWLRRSIAIRSAEKTHGILDTQRLNTVCESALCPNRNECYAHGTSTFMILGNTCTRSCAFCAINPGKPEILQDDEPERVAQAAKQLGLRYVVITSVARDDLKDEGAGHFARVITAVKKELPGVHIEVLTPDFHARKELLTTILDAGPTVFNHNIETVERLQKSIRPQSAYERSLKVLSVVKEIDPQMTTKSGMMLGLGETFDEIRQTARDLHAAGCDILTLGQYLPPGKDFLQVSKFISPEVFSQLAEEFKSFGFREVYAGPYVRSSYHAGETFINSLNSSAKGGVTV